MFTWCRRGACDPAVCTAGCVCVLWSLSEGFLTLSSHFHHIITMKLLYNIPTALMLTLEDKYTINIVCSALRWIQSCRVWLVVCATAQAVCCCSAGFCWARGACRNEPLIYTSKCGIKSMTIGVSSLKHIVSTAGFFLKKILWSVKLSALMQQKAKQIFLYFLLP